MPKKPEYDITQAELMTQRLEGMIDEFDELLGYYKTAQSFYSYKNLEGHVVSILL